MTSQKFQKPPLTSQEHIELLQSRGLQISNMQQALHYLEYVGYYRLSGYFWFFYTKNQHQKHEFVPGITFSNIIAVYEFDTALRALILCGIERIEVAVRSVIANHMSGKYGPHWYLDRKLFKADFNYDDLITQIKKETDFFSKGGKRLIFKSYYNKYDEPELPASWMLVEALSFGSWSKIFAYLSKDVDRNLIAKKFNLSYPVFESWVQAMCFTRNLCAHHSMVCYRNFHIIPIKPTAWSSAKQKPFLKPHSLYLQMFIIQYFLRAIKLDNNWATQLSTLLQQHREISLANMGFEPGWTRDEIWQQSIQSCMYI